MFEYQAPAVLNQAAPVNGTWYDILPATDYVRVYQIAVNVEDTDETLEVQAIIDGETIQADDLACTHSTIYYGIRYLQPINRTDQIALTTASTIQLFDAQAFILEGHNVQIQVRKTTAAGAGNLTGIVQYGVLKHASI
jgi:hypothetical protein